MFLPRFTIRRLLQIMVVCGLLFLVASYAVRGAEWAAGVTIAVGSTLAALLVYAVFFCIAWWISLVVDSYQPRPKHKSPFAQGSPPPQLIRPEDPE